MIRPQAQPEFKSFYRDPEVAKRYDRERARTVKQQVVRAMEREFFLTNISPQQSVLEIGAGTGEITAELSRRARVKAIDVSPEMLEQAKRKISADSVRFAVLDMFKLDQLEETFDSVLSSRVFLHLHPTDLVRMLRLAAERLVPGGRLIFDLQRPSLFRIALAQFERHKVENPCYSRSSVIQAVGAVSDLELVTLSAFDHWPLLLPLAFLSGSKSPGTLHRLAMSAENSLLNVPIGASRWGVVCRRR